MPDKKMQKNVIELGENILHDNPYQNIKSLDIYQNDSVSILTNNNKNKQKNAKNKYECDLCNFASPNKYNYSMHLTTEKHLKMFNNLKDNSSNKYECKCGKIYNHRQSLHVHRKKCDFKEEDKINENKINKKEDDFYYKECILFIMNQLKSQGEQNTCVQNTLLDLIPKIGGSINNSNINSNNKNFNINIFLNENCKDAMNIGDFVKNIEVSVKDLLVSKENGIVDGISNLIVTHLNKIPLIERPLWCSDKSKKKIFIKDESWEEDLNCEKTGKAIEDVSKLQARNINKFIVDNPNWMNNEKLKEQYIDIVKKATEPIHNKKTKIVDKLLDTIYLKDENMNQMKIEQTK